ncbi:hypothetical protein AAZX31_17G003800 [Glycine max]|uniref:Serine aminopeptidase S33 domain-containing protein n=2 Tax=Glycine subgen. Soja TaxID=1462606 RepID=K7MJ87_SOYBN|nr:uncharacterized protein LOC100784510 [Glycine max]XP_014625505.1 uncharacterized protein LOC100784510 [Glycine max]XP_014625506.1 uncharacterized protein LOC100784510 [Glycine max]XP_028211654.1 uncharacterized protein LOC114394202 [Glycine soja]XP_028211655.1 uncharacterized protein LOC114394202 [Glycine soja]XP_028211656.1 uncharacterized protein LOC114394202 [Glycine soja]KAG4931864.1 hypothetical protein JHK87_045866 [Glycine soja]KAH1116061.1 hypothetical protein GYH30_045807 [Glycin|eukprot:XP_006600274.1 uncharacterized protein LOC100784510 [Glycine max]
MIEQFINFVIRPPRAEYNPDQYLWEKEFTLTGRTYQRQDLELKNTRGYTLKCSHYLPSPFPEDTSLPCVIYCHGNSGCRADANEAAVILLPSNITVFTLDFSGSGLSDGDYVSLGWHEKDDLKMVVSYLRSNKQISRIGLWGRSMGAVTSLLYGAEDPSIAGMVLDSAFSNLYDLMMELVDVYKIRLPKFTVKMAVQYMRRVIEKKAKFDIMNLNCLQVAPKTFIPVLFGHASDDKFIQPHHSDLISEAYAGDKNVIKFDGDHNSSRPQFFYDSVSIFFYNVLHPPNVPRAHKLEKYYNLGDLKLGSGVDESLLYEILSSLRSASTDAASSSSVLPAISSTKSVSELLSEVAPVTDTESFFREDTNGNDEATDVQDKKLNGEGEDCCSYTSSNRESWGRCSSLGGSDEESCADDTLSQVFATPMRSTNEKEKDDDKKHEEKKKKKKGKKPKSERFEKLEALSRRLRLCLLKGSTHGRHKST